MVQDRSIGEVAKSAFTGIFASTRNRRSSNTQAVGASTPGNMQFGRRGPRGSIAALSIHTNTSDDSDTGDDSILNMQGLPGMFSSIFSFTF